MNKRLNILYFSATGRTAQVVKAIADGMSSSYKEYDVTLVGSRGNAVAFNEDDVIIVGTPVYGGRVLEFLTDYFKNVKGNNAIAIFVVVYGNRNYDDALLELKDIFETNGFVGFASGAFIGEHSFTNKVGTTRPDQNDLKIARDFGVEINKKLSEMKDKSRLTGGFVKGNFPYKERKPKSFMRLVTNNQCTGCGICAKNCPVGAIDFNDLSKIDMEMCIHCCRCIHKCPSNAKSMNDEQFENTIQWLIERCSKVRHEPEIEFREAYK